MSRLIPFLLIFLVCSIALADSAADVNQAATPFLLQGETFTKALHVIGGRDYYFVSINGTESIVFATYGGVRPVSNESELRDLLAQELSETNVSVEAFLPNSTEKDRIWGYVLAFNESRKRERDCAALIGMDRFPCYDLETCWRACYTPACQTMKLGSGAFFLTLEQKMYLNITFIGGNMSEFGETLYALSPNSTTTRTELESLLGNIRGIREACGNVESNSIQQRSGVGFCYAVVYEYGGLINASADITRRRDALMPLFTADETASLLHNRTLERLGVKEANLARPLCLQVKGDAEVELGRAKASANRALSLVSSAEISSDKQELDASYAGLDCANSSNQGIRAFTSSFFRISAGLNAAASSAIRAYESTSQKLNGSKSQLSALQAQAPNDEEVQAVAASIAALDSRLRAMPNPEELPQISAEIGGNTSRMAELKAQFEQRQTFNYYALGAGAVLIAMAIFVAARAMNSTPKKKSRG